MAGTVDLYRDFIYCRSTALVGQTDTIIPIDDASRLPTQAELDKSSFQLTFESSFGEGAFEIVQVLEVGPSSITVARAQDGSQAFAHPAYTILKGALTSGMLRRARAAFSFLDVPAPDLDLFVQGDFLWDARFKKLYILDEGQWRDATASAQSTADQAYILVSQLVSAVSDLELADTSASIHATLGALVSSIADLDDQLQARDRSAVIVTIVQAIADIQEARAREAAEIDAVTAAIALGG